jgi:hypothetical protein
MPSEERYKRRGLVGETIGEKVDTIDLGAMATIY